jgi:hypothetical protein
MNELKYELELALGKSKPVPYSILFAINFKGEAFLMDGDELNVIYEILDGEVNECLTSIKGIPTEIGIYKGNLVVHSFKSNSYFDPDEWDMNLFIEDIEPIKVWTL